MKIDIFNAGYFSFWPFLIFPPWKINTLPRRSLPQDCAVSKLPPSNLIQTKNLHQILVVHLNINYLKNKYICYIHINICYIILYTYFMLVITVIFKDFHSTNPLCLSLFSCIFYIKKMQICIEQKVNGVKTTVILFCKIIFNHI